MQGWLDHHLNERAALERNKALTEAMVAATAANAVGCSASVAGAITCGIGLVNGCPSVAVDIGAGLAVFGFGLSTAGLGCWLWLRGKRGAA